ncbi:MAG: DMT family transporter [Chlamydiota bacterium]
MTSAQTESPHTPGFHLRRGVALILLAWVFFTVMSPLVRQVSEHLPITAILCMQGIVGALCVMPWMVKHGKESFKTKSWGLILVRTGAGLLVYTFLLLAILHTSLVDAYLLSNATPLLLPMIVWIWRRTPIEHILWPGIFVGFIGILLILKPGAEILNIGALYGVGAALFGAIAMVALRLLSYTTRSHTVLFYYFLLSALVTFPLVIWSGKFPSGVDWIKLLSIACLATVAQVTMIRAFHHAKPTVLGPFNYAAVVYAGVLDWILYGTQPDLFAWIGIVLICCGGIWSIRFSSPSAPSQS